MTTPSLRSNAPGRAIQTTVNELNRRLENKATVTLATNATTTTVRDPRLFESSFAILVPLTATAAQEIASGSCFVSRYSTGSISINHSQNAVTDRRFGLVIF